MANLYTKASAQLDANPRVHRVVLIMDKLSASRHFKYLFIDDAKQVILPRVGHLTWPRLQGVVGFRVAVLKNCMYVIGGKDKQSGKASNQVLKYDPMRNRWFQCAGLKQGRIEHAAVAIGGKILVTGGLSSTNEMLFTCESYEPLLDEWTLDAPLLAPRAGHQMLERDKTVYLTGGNTPQAPGNGSSTFWRTERSVDPDNPHQTKMCWTNVTANQLPVSLRNHLHRHVMVTYTDKIFFFGGVRHVFTQDGNLFLSPAEEERRLSRLNLTESTQNREAKTESKKVNITSNVAQAFRLKSRGTVAEVMQVEGVHESEVSMEVVRRNHKPWKQCRDMLQPRSGAGTVTLGNKIYLIGGHKIEENEESYVETVEYFNPRKNKWYEAFSLGAGSYRDVDCCILSVAVTNKDFRHDAISYDWVMW